MYLIKSKEQFKEHYTVYNCDEMPKKYPFYMYTFTDNRNRSHYKALYAEDLNEMVSRLECVVL